MILAQLGSISLPNTQHGIGIWVSPNMGGHTKTTPFSWESTIHQNQNPSIILNHQDPSKLQ
jgi:hypothetical protein